MTTDRPGDLDRAAARAMYREYAAATGRPADDEPPVERFGDGAALADELLGLVLAGTKRATAGLVADFAADGEPLPRIGGHWIVCDGAGVPRCVLRSTELRLGPLHSVDDAFAWDEGEGDRSRASWLDGHERYFRRTQAARGEEWSDDLEVVFERFRVVWPPEVADHDIVGLPADTAARGRPDRRGADVGVPVGNPPGPATEPPRASGPSS